MKFITEEDLRDLYKKQPFTDYDLKEGERLTPGARQFLVDRGCLLYTSLDACLREMYRTSVIRAPWTYACLLYTSRCV